MNYYSDRTKKRNSFNLRNDIYIPRVDNNVTKQFGEIHNSIQNNPIKNTEYTTYEITDAQGSERAYQHGDYYIHGNTMYIAGSHTAKDWYDDVTKLPVWGDLRNSTRYQAAKAALMENPQVKRTFGHSLGGKCSVRTTTEL